MEWIDALSGIFQRYRGAGGGTAASPANPHEDFAQVARTAPQDVTSAGIEEAFRSDQTPPFPQMVSQLFHHADENKRAGLLNRLLALAPGGLAAVPGLSSLLGGARQVTPEQARQVQPQQVEQLAAHAEQTNPGAVKDVSSFASQHPDVLKALGGLAATIALQHIARRH